MGVNKTDIIEAIRRTAKENGGIPLGRGRFVRETGIKERDVYKFWSSFGEAHREAGFEPNTLRAAHSVELLIESVISLMREVGRFPTHANFIGRRYKDSKFPNPESFRRLGNKEEMIRKIHENAKQKGYNDIIEMCAPAIQSSRKTENDDGAQGQVFGEVYLCKSGRYYKIGKSTDFDRRISEIKMPHKTEEIHRIKTDDPSGVEAYWHKRFAKKRMNNSEWFDLSFADVRAFKCWRRIT